MTTNDRKPDTSRWKGADTTHTNYRCRMCNFTTLHKAKFEDHIRLAHPPFEVIDGGKADDTSAGASGTKKES